MQSRLARRLLLLPALPFALVIVALLGCCTASSWRRWDWNQIAPAARYWTFERCGRDRETSFTHTKEGAGDGTSV